LLAAHRAYALTAPHLPTYLLLNYPRMPRPTRLGRRQAAVDRTATSILSATRELVAETGRGVTVAAIARRAGVTRVTVYNRFGSLAALLGALTPEHRTEADGLRAPLERS